MILYSSFARHVPIVALLWSCNGPAASPGERMPCVGIEGERGAEGISFKFWADVAHTTPAVIDAVYVFQMAEAQNRESAICMVRFEEPPASGWLYGSNPVGSATKGACSALGIGRYRVSASGAGLGARAFRIAEDGTLVWEAPLC
jgi:hypothetical protein